MSRRNSQPDAGEERFKRFKRVGSYILALYALIAGGIAVWRMISNPEADIVAIIGSLISLLPAFGL